MAAFDAGDRDEAVRIATAIRILVHATRRSTSLLTHLGVKGITRLVTTSSQSPVDENAILQLGTTFHFGDDGPVAQAPTREHWKLVPIEHWWNETLHVFDAGATRITRATMVLGAATKEGGAHVDPELTGVFKKGRRGRRAPPYAWLR